MVKNQRVREILKVLEVYPKLNYTNLKKIVVQDNDDMSPQTFTNALKQGVDSRIIKREVDHYKKRKIVYYSKPENAKEEDDYYRELISDVDSFTHRLDILKEQFSKLNNIEKGKILFSFNDWVTVISSKIGIGFGIFRSSRFSDLYQSFIVSTIQEILRLSLSGDHKQQSAILNEYFLGWNDIKQDCSEEIDEILEIARKTK